MHFRNALLFLGAVAPAVYAEHGQREVTLSLVSYDPLIDLLILT
jgi:hypothetical protein